MAENGWDHSGFLDDDLDEDNPFMEKVAPDANPFTKQPPASKPPAYKSNATKSTKPKGAEAKKPKSREGSKKGGFGEQPINNSASFAEDVLSVSELRAREAELREREAALEVREVEAGLIEQRNTPNYPPFPSFCCIKPWVYHNIQDELPQASWARQKAYWSYWHFHWAVLTCNMFAAAVQMNLVGTNGLEGPLITLIFAIIYWFIFTYTGFYGLYRLLYNGVKQGSSIKLVLHLTLQFLHSCYAIYMAIGAMNTGGAGFIGAVDLLNHGHTVSGIILITQGIVWSIDSFAGAIFFYIHYKFFKENGHSLAEAQSQAFTSAASNKSIQDATFTIAESAMQNKA